MNGAELLEPFKNQISSFMWMALVFIVGLLIKDLLTTFVYGLMFYLDKAFNEGDEVIIDDKEAIIIKIGLRKTVFMLKENGNWIYIPNDKVRYHKLEKRKRNGYK